LVGRLQVTGLELLPLKGPLLLVGDHDSYWDTVATGIAAMPRPQIRALAKSSLWKNNLLGSVLTGMGQIPIERGSGDSGALDRAIEELRKGACIGIYPEGTRSLGRALRARTRYSCDSPGNVIAIVLPSLRSRARLRSGDSGHWVIDRELPGTNRSPSCTEPAQLRNVAWELTIGETSLVTMPLDGRTNRAPRPWADEAVRRIEADANRSSDTHLHAFPLPEEWGVDLYLKDESVHPTGSLKHRLARSLFLYGLCNGWIQEGTTIVDASSGSTAVSEAYFARFLGLPFIAVMPAATSHEKIALIEAQGGICHLVDDPTTVYDEAQRLAIERSGFFLDQFTYAERATDWRGNNNIAESIFSQMALERHPIPAWIVVGAGTGGTSATIGRYARFGQHPTQMCVVDPEDSIFYSVWSGDPTAFTGRPSRIEGIGRQRREPSFLPDIIDRMIQVPDSASIATMRLVHERTGRSVGGSTGTNVWGAFTLVAEMVSRGERGSVVTLICDSGTRYADTYYDDAWVAEQGLELTPWREALDAFLERGVLPGVTAPA
jgi:cysteine synthase